MLRIVLSLLVLMVACSTEPNGVQQFDDDPVAAVAKPIVLPPCGIWFGASPDEADRRSLTRIIPDAQFNINGFSTCVDAIMSCAAIHAREPDRYCQVRYVSTSADGIGTSPSEPGSPGL